jgi:hypothetical protein
MADTKLSLRQEPPVPPTRPLAPKTILRIALLIPSVKGKTAGEGSKETFGKIHRLLCC